MAGVPKQCGIQSLSDTSTHDSVGPYGQKMGSCGHCLPKLIFLHICVPWGPDYQKIKGVQFSNPGNPS